MIGIVTDGRAVEELVVGVLGGTGPQGRGLAVRLAAAGQRILLGSRDADRASEVAAQVAARASAAAGGDASVQGGANADVAGAADLVIVAVPFDGHAATLAELATPLAGKVVVDCVNPLGFDGKGPFALKVPDGSACEEAQAVLNSRATSADPYIAWVKEGRKYDLGALLITQQPGSIPGEILSQGDNWFIFHLLAAEDLTNPTHY